MQTQELIDSINEAHQRSELSDEAILRAVMHETDVNAPWLSYKQTYTWCYLIGQIIRPKTIVEIGTRYGYSMISLMTGAMSGASCEQVCGHCYDIQLWPNCNAIAAENFKKLNLPVVINDVDTQIMERLPEREVDVFHVDGDHSADGAYHDCVLGFLALKDGGVLIADDARHDNVREGVHKFALDYNIPMIVLGTYNGLAVGIVRK